jgi:hypothetical protein
MNNGRENEKKFLEGELEERRGSGRASINSAGRFFLEGLFLKGDGIENFRFEDGFSDSGTSEGRYLYSVYLIISESALPNRGGKWEVKEHFMSGFL